jgi:hypothetical protein
VHSGWATLIVLAEPLQAPTVLSRTRIDLADSAIAGSKQPYHAIQELHVSHAERILRACVCASERMAQSAVQAAISDATQKGFRVSSCGILSGSGKPLPPLEKILSSHPLLHTAEGELFRNVIATACKDWGLFVREVKEKALVLRSSTELRGSEAVLVSMGKMLGPPWRQDEKFATLVAWLALAAEARSVGKRSASPPTKQRDIGARD